MLNEQLKRRNNTYEEETLGQKDLGSTARSAALGGHRLLVRDPEGCQEPGGPSHGRPAGLSRKENFQAWHACVRALIPG